MDFWLVLGKLRWESFKHVNNESLRTNISDTSVKRTQSVSLLRRTNVSCPHRVVHLGVSRCTMSSGALWQAWRTCNEEYTSDALGRHQKIGTGRFELNWNHWDDTYDDSCCPGTGTKPKSGQTQVVGPFWRWPPP